MEAGTRSLCNVVNKNSDSEVRLSGFEFPPLPRLAVVVNMPMSQLSFTCKMRILRVLGRLNEIIQTIALLGAWCMVHSDLL